MEVIPEQPDAAPQEQVVVHELRAALAAKDATIAKLQSDLERIKAQLEKQLRARFGKSSEVIDPATLLPFAQESLLGMLADGQAVAEQVKEEQTQAGSIEPSAKGQPKRKPIPARMERVRIVHALSEAERTCPCCGERACKSGEAISEVFQYVPARVFVEQHVVEKYACPKCRHNGCGHAGCEGRMLQASKPPQAIEKGLAGSGLLAQVAVGKYGDHLPLHRMEDILPRHGLDITRNTLCGWMLQGSKLLIPLVAMMKSIILESIVMQLDDTTVRMLDPGQKKTTTARCWLYQGDEKHRFTVFDFQTDRCEEHPENWFKGQAFTGHGQGDAYGGYNPLFHPQRPEGPLTPVGCWAHVRRKFNDAKQAGDKSADGILFLIQKLYTIEKAAKVEARLDDKGPTHAGGKDPKGRILTPENIDKLWRIRKEKRGESRGILEKQIKPWLDAMQAKTLPRSSMGEALTYAQNQWPRLVEYAKHGHVEIDNNAAERSLRCVAIGRKNWQFVGSPRGGKTLATYASVIASARQYGHEPYAYLRDLFEKLPVLRNAGWPEEELRKFLPDRWKMPAR